MAEPCFWCHDVDTHGPVTLTSYLPCPTCRDTFEGRLLVMEVDFADKLGQPGIAGTGLAPTGAHVVLEMSALDVMNLTDDQKDQTRKAGKLLLEPVVFQRLLKEMQRA